ncbi:hypothetical protein MSAN_01114200 [Mycena sanguinolenta]|uniref:Uncharacterized protein n=1 Tax=Mycena sanguinolenta TaxID=230812 RepID=A0A8H6YJ97_9AGAR|nr:hypothetical protein MSAN_01114200 [Mycena sanguinolenta]
MTTTMPPTTHALPHAHRLRLMRSTRKLGELLGETPLLVETLPTATSSVSTHSRSASTFTSEAASHGDSSHLARPMLLLHLPATSSSTAERTSVQSPLSPTFSLTLNSPVTPTFVVDTRRRKMAKLTRTLGENVPPELVFPTFKSRRRASTLSIPESMLERSSSDTHDSSSTHASTSSHEPLLPPSRPHRNTYRKEQGWSGEWVGNVADMDDVVRRLRGLKK